jgi:hypothetical protein
MRALDSLLRLLASLSARTYLLIYVGVIAGFAGLYCWIAPDFYHPYARFETPISDAGTDLAKDLEEAFRIQLKKELLLPDKASVNLDQLKVGRLTANEDGIAFDLYLVVVSGAGPVIYGSIPLSIDPDDRIPIGESDEIIGLHPQPQKAKGGHLSLLDKNPIVKDSKEIGMALLTATAVIMVPRSVVSRLEGFNQAHGGFPSRVPGVFGRMLYLSAVTIATVGYGDVVPLTGRARFLTGLEAILGIVFLGLFINSLGLLRPQSARSERT